MIGEGHGPVAPLPLGSATADWLQLVPAFGRQTVHEQVVLCHMTHFKS